MTKLQYKSTVIPGLDSPTALLLSDIQNGNGSQLEISVSGIECSFLIILGKKYKIQGSRAVIDLDEISSGIAEVQMVSGTKKIFASPFFKNGNKIERLPIDNASAKIIEAILTELTKKLAAAEEKIAVLEEKIVPKNMFNFN